MFWKFRGEIIFGAAACFAVKSLILPDFASVAGLILFLGAHYADRFFGSERVESKALARMTALESELKAVKQDISRLSMSVGIRSMK